VERNRKAGQNPPRVVAPIEVVVVVVVAVVVAVAAAAAAAAPAPAPSSEIRSILTLLADSQHN